MKSCCETAIPTRTLEVRNILGLIAIILVGITILNASIFGESNKDLKSVRSESQQIIADSTAPAKSPKSPRMTANSTIGKTAVTLDYGSPRVRGRVIWGGLVGYGAVWATGAHHATSISFSRDVVINGKTVQAGKYALFTIPDKNEWTVILNKNYDQHLADEYDEKLDVLRVKAISKPLEKVQEEMMFSITEKSANEGIISFAWEKITWSFAFKTL